MSQSNHFPSADEVDTIRGCSNAEVIVQYFFQHFITRSAPRDASPQSSSAHISTCTIEIASIWYADGHGVYLFYKAVYTAVIVAQGRLRLNKPFVLRRSCSWDRAETVKLYKLAAGVGRMLATPCILSFGDLMMDGTDEMMLYYM